MILIPGYAKKDARNALRMRQELSESKKYGLDKDEARKLGINSGVERAKQIVNNKHLPREDAERVAAFYNRFKNCRTQKCEGAIDLWGGRRFGRELQKKLKEKQRR